MKANNIVLTGMPGCGKSYFGLKLASILSEYTFYDTDSIIEKTQGMKISDIFEKYSEDYFRKLEYDTIKMLCTGQNKIISIGGGAFENPDTRNRLLNFGIVYYLKTDINVLYNRLSNENERPLLKDNNKKLVLENLLNKREANYQKADYIIYTDKLSEDEIIKLITGNKNETNSSCRSKQL